MTGTTVSAISHPSPMKCRLSFPRLLTAFATAAVLHGQTGAPSPPGTPGLVPASPSDQTVNLDPFEVSADSDKSYGALNSRSMTAFNVALDHLPISADIFDQAFMLDVGATSVEDMVQTYSAGAGMSGLNAGSTASQNQPGDRVNLNYTQLRGMQTPNTQRDSLLYMGTLGGPGGTSIAYTSNFDLERVELIDGPQALLYDGGGAGGVINVVSKQARIGAPAFGSVTFRTDEWGTKSALLDYGVSRGNFAVRVAWIDASDQTRRINVGDHLAGTYVQLAAQLGKTVVRLSLEQTRDLRNASAYTTLTTTADPQFAGQNSYSLGYSMATNQAGALDNGRLNWGNLNSFDGFLSGDDTVAGFATLSADTQWTDWLSTQFSAGISEFFDDHFMDSGAIGLFSPASSANPIPGNWTMGMTGAFSASDAVRPYHGQAMRFSALATKDLFGGKAKTQSIVGVDMVDNRGAIIQYAYFQADSNWNIVTTPTVTANLGRTVLPKLSWTVNNGPLLYPAFRLGAPRITYNGVNYVRAQEDPFVPALVSPANPNGAALIGGAAGTRNDLINDGIYAVNDTQWLDGKLDTLFGVRLEHSYTYTSRAEKNPPSLTPVEIIDSHSFNFNAGADYHILPWLAPYFSVSDSYLVPPDLQNDPNGSPLAVSQALGQEIGVKITNAEKTLSGSLAAYHVSAKNQEFLMVSNLENDINPSGLNGIYDSDSSSGYTADTQSKGIQLVMTATPTSNWRLRLSAAVASGTIETTRIYHQLYDDQFNENSSGQVTYADGTVVYVAPTFDSKTPAYTQATAPAGSVPLTVTALSTPGGTYYGSPAAGTGTILSSSNAAKVLLSTDPAHGAILTGATGLPISAYQLNPALTGVSVAGAVPVAIAGESTTGYPEFSVNLTSLYTVPSGPLKGVEVGGTAIGGWKNAPTITIPAGLTSPPISPPDASSFMHARRRPVST